MKSKYFERRDILSGMVGFGASLPLSGCVMPRIANAAIPVHTGYSAGPALTVKRKVIPKSITKIATSGYRASSDGGAWQYKRVDSRPEHGFALQDASGAWFEGMIIEGAIMPGPFGALADTQNEGIYLQEAMQVAIALNCWLNLDPTKTYVVDPSQQGKNGWYAIAKTGQSILLDFNGATVKMAPAMPTRGNSFFHAFSVQMRKIRGVSNQHIPLVHIRNARVDGNLRAQGKPDYPDAYEQRALLRVMAADGNRIDRLLIEDARIIDRIADGILVGPSSDEAFDDDGDGKSENAAIKQCDIVRPYCEKATGPARSFLCLGSGCSLYNIEQPRCAPRDGNGDYNAIETEFSKIGEQSVRINIYDGRVDAFEFGMPPTVPDHERVLISATNMTIDDYYIQIGGSIRTKNCILPITKRHGVAVQYAKHNGTIFRHGLRPDGDVQSLKLRTDYTPHTRWIERNGCRHELEKSPTFKEARNAAIKISPSAKSRSQLFNVELDGTVFFGQFPASIDNYGGGVVTTRNCRLVGTNFAVRTGSFGKYTGTFRSHGDFWNRTKSGIAIEILGNAPWRNKHIISDGKGVLGEIKLRGKFARASIRASDRSFR